MTHLIPTGLHLSIKRDLILDPLANVDSPNESRGPARGGVGVTRCETSTGGPVFVSQIAGARVRQQLALKGRWFVVVGWCGPGLCCAGQARGVILSAFGGDAVGPVLGAGAAPFGHHRGALAAVRRRGWLWQWCVRLAEGHLRWQ
jgi:hypothetical protein